MYYIYKYIYSYMIIYLYTVGPLKAFPSARALWQISVLKGRRDFCTKQRERNRKQGSKAFIKDR